MEEKNNNTVQSVPENPQNMSNNLSGVTQTTTTRQVDESTSISKTETVDYMQAKVAIIEEKINQLIQSQVQQQATLAKVGNVNYQLLSEVTSMGATGKPTPKKELKW